MKKRAKANENEYDFSGWATRNNIRCSDGRTIMRDAFKVNDGQTVPLVWNHRHDDPFNVLGHALLENREEGVYAYCTFNNTESGKNAKTLVENGDVSALSIYANQLKHNGANVMHGKICEVSLVLAGANPGASIQSILRHGEETTYEEDVFTEEADIFTGEEISLYHSDKTEDEGGKEMAAEDNGMKTKETEKTGETEKAKKGDGEETVADIFDSLSEKQKTVVYALIGEALEDRRNEKTDDKTDKGGKDTMKHNVFDTEDTNENNFLSHSEQEAIFADAKRYGSLKDSVLAHGIENLEYLFPDAKAVTNTPQFIQRDMGWVQKVMSSVHHTPFSRIKSVLANITEDEARAKGYIKGKLKKDEVFSLLKRTTDPTTVYKKQKLDRDDVVDITDFDVVSWLKTEMRMMLDEELARAFLISDGRLASSDDKINETHIRPIAFDDDLYTIKAVVDAGTAPSGTELAREFITTAIKARKKYKGSGSPTLYTTEDILTDCLLLEDTTGRSLYEDESKLAKKLRVKEIVTVPPMESAKGKSGGALMGIIVNLEDYNVGADKGGAVNLFDDFDIDYNAQKYLIETRCSGALIKPYAAIALEAKAAAVDSTGD